MALTDAFELVSCHCKKCDTKLWECQNLWTPISTLHLTLSSNVKGLILEHIDTVSIASKESEGLHHFAGSKLNKFHCKRCKSNLGVRCSRAPKQLEAHLGQAVLKQSRVHLRDLQTSAPVKFNLQESTGALELPTRTVGNTETMQRFPNPFSQLPTGGDSSKLNRSISRSSLDPINDTGLGSLNAKLSVITSQTTANGSRLEAQRVQMEEQQRQIDAVSYQQQQMMDLLMDVQQRQIDATNNQQQIMSLLETLQASVASLHELPSLSPRTSGRVHSSSVQAINLLHNKEPTETDKSIPKIKRGRGRPRLYCAGCRKQTVADNSRYCENCEEDHGEMNGHKRRASTSLNGVFKQRRVSSSSQSMDDDRSQDPSIIILTNELEEDEYLDTEPSQRHQQPPLSTGKVNKTYSSQQCVKERNDAASHTTRELQIDQRAIPPSQSRKLQFPSNGPFEEDSLPRDSVYDDIVDLMATGVLSQLDDHASPSNPSVAESVLIDDAYHEDLEMLDSITSQSDRRLQTQRDLVTVGQTSAAQTTVDKDAKHTKKPSVPLSKSKKSNGAQIVSKTKTKDRMLSSSPLPAKPRKPLQRDVPDGDRDHHQLVHKIVGPSWSGVKRKF